LSITSGKEEHTAFYPQSDTMVQEFVLHSWKL